MSIAEARSMKATELLKQQHQEVARLFKAIESAEDAGQKKAFFLELASNLVGHDGIEREIFYPACEEDDFDFKVKVLKELVEHHVEEEEDEFFPKAEKALGKDTLELLTEELTEAFEEAREGDFQGPLYENLRQVFAGAIKTDPKKSEPARPKKSRKTA
jgi:hypothetical protein